MAGDATDLAGDIAMSAFDQDPSRRQPTWHRGVATSTVIFAALAAVAALFAGITTHELIIERTAEIVESAEASASRLSAQTLQSKHEILTALGLPVDPDEVEAIAAYEAAAAEFATESTDAETEALLTSSIHLVFATSAALLGVGIVVTGLSVIISRRWLWGAGSFISIVGTALLGTGLWSVLAT